MRCSLHERSSFTLARKNGSGVWIIDQRPGHLSDLVIVAHVLDIVQVDLIVPSFELVIRRRRHILDVSLSFQNRLKFASADRCRAMARSRVALLGTCSLYICHLLLLVLEDSGYLLRILVVGEL